MAGVSDTQLISDPWSPFSHKKAMRDLGNSAGPFAPWFRADARRLTAYRIAQDYIDNQARQHLDTTDDDTVAQHREYGDAATIVNTALAALLGDEQSIVIPEAETYDADLEPPPGDGSPPEPDETGQSTPRSDTTPEEWAANAEALKAVERQEWLRQWAVDSRFWLRMTSNERKAVGLGDAVYVLGWNTRKGRVDVKTYDPGAYFPDLDTLEDSDGDWPTRVHIAFVIEPRDDGDTKRLRRITWELVPIPFASAGVINDDGQLDRETIFEDRDGELVPVPRQGDRVDARTGRIMRRYPWTPQGEESDLTCVMTDAEWPYEDIKGQSVYDLSYEKAQFRVAADGEVIRRLDIGYDFIPVIHEPNTIADDEHYGRSTLATVLQILDDLAAADTDLSKAAATTGSPVIALSGATFAKGERRTYGPGEVFDVGDGTMTMLDTSKALDALLKMIEALFARLSVNSRIPESVLGRVKPSEVPSGVALALSFGPLQSMVREMRQVRDEKYPILLRFVQRIAMVGKDRKGRPGLEAGAVYDAQIGFGSYLPADKSAAVEAVTKLLAEKAISRLTAIRMLVEAGFEIDDAVKEVERIEHDDFEGAIALFEALGSTAAVKEYLGREHDPDPESPAATVPPVDVTGGQRSSSTVPPVPEPAGTGA